jgi:hypothetical protein
MEITNKKIIVCLTVDLSLYWVHNLEHDKKLIVDENEYSIYQSNKCLYFYGKKDFNNLYNHINQLSNKNYIHIVLSDFSNINETLLFLDNENKYDYSLINHMGETIFDHHPINVKYLKNLKYYFSCSDLLNKDNVSLSEFQKENKFILDYRYSLIYFYIKLGFNFFERGEHKFLNERRKNKLFIYSKSKVGSEREKLLSEIVILDRVDNKKFSEDDIFWNEINYNNYHISFYLDYISCKLNLIAETQPPSFNVQPTLSRFLTEKTLKSLITPTPSYLLCQKETYESLKEHGFYFLNEEFGEYNLDNYKKFITFIKDTTDEHFDNFFQITYQKSKLNKLKLEEYIYSDKIKEIKLLLNEQI